MTSTAVISNAIVLEVLNQHNYKDWSSRVESYLLAEELWDVINSDPPKQEDREASGSEAWTKKNAKAVHAIKISCGPELFSFIREIRTAKIAWEVLEKQFKSHYILKKEREERVKSLCTVIEDAEKTRDAGEELVPADEDWKIKGSKAGNENYYDANYDYNSSYDPFFDYASHGDWDNAKDCLAKLHPNAVRARKPETGNTALHLAVGEGHVNIVKELVLLMTQEDLGIRNSLGATALHVAVLYGNVHIAKELAMLMKEEDLETKNTKGLNILHLAVLNGRADIVKEVVPLMRREGLEMKDNAGYTALGCALELCYRRGDKYSNRDVIEMSKYMVEKNPKLLRIALPPHNLIPVVDACNWMKVEVARYLYSVTPPEALRPPKNGSQGASLICCCLKAKDLDIGWDLLFHCPSLATVENVYGDSSPILALSRFHSTFVRGMQLKFWQQWIYDNISEQLPADLNIHEVSINVINSEDDQGNQSDVSTSVINLFRGLYKGLLETSGIHGIYEMKSTHLRIIESIRCIGEVTRNVDELSLAEYNMVKRSLFGAIERGDVEFVTHMCKANPKLVETFDENQRSIFHFAIECRQEKIYNLIYGLKKQKINQFGLSVANFNNNMLHSAGNLSPLSKLNHIHGASLQLQRELQWFEEVKHVVPLGMHASRNSSEDLTARELFHRNHKELMEEAEKSMKQTATSCTVIGALIVTIMFAAAFTIPGGNNGTTGFPMFIDKYLFLVFIVSDTISLISSTNSVIIFLGILTSRYAEDDFLKNLPTKMMIGLFTLFISIATMMSAFSSGLVIMLHGKYSWMVFPTILVACIPVTSFVWMLFPLLRQTLVSTYGPGIFNRKVKRWY